MENRYIIPSNVSYRRVGEEMFVLNRNETSIFNLNATAAVVWDAIRTGGTTKDIIALIVDHFNVDHETARRDAVELIENLVEKKLLIKT